MKLDHVLILAHDMAAMRAFLVDAIGLEDGPRPPFPFPGHWLYSEGAPLIHLAAAGIDGDRSAYLGARQATAGGPVDHLALSGADFAALVERLDRLGIPSTIRHVPLDRTVQVFVAGPEGVRIEFQFPDNPVSSKGPQ